MPSRPHPSASTSRLFHLSALPLKMPSVPCTSGVCPLPIVMVDLQPESGSWKRDPVSLNSWAAVCLNVLAKPVTNSVYYKAARSRLPGQGWIQLEWCVRLGELFLEFRHRTSLWSRLDFSSVCPLHQSRSLLSRDSHAAPASPPGTLPPVFGSVYLLIRGWSRGWSRAGAQSESGPREPIRIALGHSRGPNSRSLLEKEFSKRSLWSQVL